MSMFNKNYRLLNYSLIVAMLLGQSPLPAYATVSSFDDKVGIGDPSPDGILELDVEGPIGATQYCDQNGANCTAAADLGGGKWLDGVGTNEIYYSAADVGIGTNAPARSLHISKNTPYIRLQDSNNTSSTADAMVEMYDSAGTQLAWMGRTNNVLYLRNVNGDDIRIGTANSNDLTIEPSGEVGIGTTTPTEELHVFKSQSNPTTIVAGNTSTSSNTNTRAGFSAAANAGQLDIMHYGSAATGSLGGVNKADAAYIRTSTTAPSASLNIGTGSNTTMNLFTNEARRVTILGNGNVGIGDTSPSQKLEVGGNINATGTVYQGDGKNIIQYDDAWLRINPSGNFTSGIYAGTGVLRNDGEFQIANNGSRFVVETSGEVGIGTQDPASALHINGSAANIILTDSDTGADAYIASNSTVGGVQISADANNEVANSYVDLAVDGSTRLRVTSTGAVGIGDNTPDGSLKLDVAGNIGANNYCDSNGNNCTAAAALGGGKWLDGVGANEIYYSAANVGIGISNPITKLHTYHATVNSQALFESGDAGASIALSDNTGSTMIYTNNSGDLRLYAGGDAGTTGNNSSVGLTIDGPTKAVGIGTNAPSEELTVTKSQNNAPTSVVVQNSSTGTGTNTRASFTAAANGGQLEVMHYGSAASGTIGGVNKADAALIRTLSGSPSASLNVGTGGTVPLNFFTNDVTRVTVASAGNVGIGTSSPNIKLHVEGGDARINSGGNGSLRFGANDQYLYGDGDSMLYYNAQSSTASQMTFRDKENTVYGRVYGASNGADFGLLDGDGHWGIRMNKDNYTAFRVNNSEKMRIQSNGNVGIGTTSSQSDLEVQGTIAATPISYTSDQDQPYLIAGANTYTGANSNWGTKGFQHRIKTNSGGTPRITVDTPSAGEAFTIENGGDVGIGDATPDGSLKLDVAGNIGANNYCDQNGNNCTAAAALGGGDNLGNHKATTTLNMNDQQISNTRIIQGKDYDDNTGGTDSKYRLLYRDGAHMFYNGGVAIGGYGNGTWSDLTDGRLIVKERLGVGTTAPGEELHVRVDQSNPTVVAVQNASSASDSDVQAGFQAQSNGNVISMFSFGSGATGSMGGKPKADAAVIRTNSGTPAALLNIGSGGNVPMHLFTNDVTRMTILGNGNIGIGETNPGDKLTVANGNIRLSNDFALKGKDSGGVSRDLIQMTAGNYTAIGDTTNASAMVVKSGDVGIGTTTPSGQLHVKDSTSTVRITGTATSAYAGSSLYMEALGSTAANRFNQVLLTMNRGTAGEASWGIQRRDDDVYTGTLMGYSDTTGWSFQTATSKTATGTNERFRILPNGNIGIGDSSPSFKLDVNGSLAATYLGRRTHSSGHLVGGYNNIGGSGANTNPIFTIGTSYNPSDTALNNMYGIGYTSASSSSSIVTGTAGGWGLYVASDGNARTFLSGGASNSYINRDGGNVGINTASPTHRLHVNGQARIPEVVFSPNNNGSTDKSSILGGSGAVQVFADTVVDFYESDNNTREFRMNLGNGNFEFSGNLRRTAGSGNLKCPTGEVMMGFSESGIICEEPTIVYN